MNRRPLLFAAFALAATLAPAAAGLPAQSQGNQPVQPQQPAAQAPAPQASKPHNDEGTRLFKQNCSRCHTAPEGFSPRISGTILRHMRVRAGLSQHDEQALLRFFNP
jgi:cytochrome c5